MDNVTGHDGSSSHDTSQSRRGFDPSVIVVPVVFLAVIAGLCILYKRCGRYLMMRCCMRRARLCSRRSHEPRIFANLDRERERVLLARSQRVNAGALLPLSPTHETPRPHPLGTSATLRGDETRVQYRLAGSSHSVATVKAASLQTRLLRHLDEHRERTAAARRLVRSTEVLFFAPPPVDLRVRPVSAPLEPPTPPTSR